MKCFILQFYKLCAMRQRCSSLIAFCMRLCAAIRGTRYIDQSEGAARGVFLMMRLVALYWC